MLSLFESAVDRHVTDIPVAVKICFGRAYGLQFSVNNENHRDDFYSSNELTLTGELRWHMLVDNNSLLHFGPYLSRSTFTATDDNNGHEKYQNYNLEPGICGGFQTLVGNHFVIDPEVYAGIENTYRNKVLEGDNFFHENKSGELEMRIFLWIGYKL